MMANRLAYAMFCVTTLGFTGCYQQMAQQPKLKPQDPSAFWMDGRSTRPLVTGTVARGQLREDAWYFTGKVKGLPPAPSTDKIPAAEVLAQYADTFPEPVTEAMLKRGQQRYNIYCTPCHGFAGFGDGTVNVRAMELMANTNGPVNGSTWVTAKSLHDPIVREHPLGMIYNVATNGVRTMAGYGTQISIEDRWAIAAYVKALQLSQNASLQDVPPELRGKLKQAEVK